MLNTGEIYLHKILRNTLCWTLWADLFTQNTGKYIMLSTEGICIYTKYLGITLCWTLWENYLHKIFGNTLSWTLWEDLFTQYIGKYFMLNTVGIFIYTKYWEIRYVEHCGNIYLHTILGNTLCWALWEDLFTQNTEE